MRREKENDFCKIALYLGCAQGVCPSGFLVFRLYLSPTNSYSTREGVRAGGPGRGPGLKKVLLRCSKCGDVPYSVGREEGGTAVRVTSHADGRAGGQTPTREETKESAG